GVFFIPSLGVIQSETTTQKLNLSEQYILQFLIDNANRPVTKSELLKAGWPERVVSEASLFQTIRSLRVKLQENSKGEIVETLPRVGYQITRFSQEVYVDKQPIEFTKITRAYLPYIMVSLLGVIMVALASLYWVYGYKYPTQDEYLTRTLTLGTTDITIIGLSNAGVDDLESKLQKIYTQHEKQGTVANLTNIMLYAYKGEQHYSVSWCRRDEANYCQPYTDQSYLIAFNDWDKFEHQTLTNLNIIRKDPIIQTDMARDPTAEVFLKFVDESGIDSQVVYHYMSKNKDGKLNHSYLTFIAEKDTEYHHALSIGSAVITQAVNNSPFMAVGELKPGMYHWAYQDNDLITENESTALMVEKQVKDRFESKTISYTYLLYHQPYLDLVLNDEVGLYWAHNSDQAATTFNYEDY
ncbi:winged helix-turn-helix domain-containing protein, partial [Photobacterium sanctipauli]